MRELVVRMLLERRDLGDGRCFYATRTRQRPWLVTFDADAVPAFEGETAWCDVDCARRPWRVVGLSQDQSPV